MFSYAFSIAFSEAFDGVINEIGIDVNDNVTTPYIGQPGVISDVSGTDLTVVSIIRYNGSGKFTCAVTDTATRLISGTMDVYYSTVNARWQAMIYLPTRYADEDGVRKGL